MKRKLISCLMAVLCYSTAVPVMAAPNMKLSVTQTEAETGSEAESETEKSDLSEDLYSFEAKIDGEKYTFPMSYEDFTSLGWEYQGDKTDKLEPSNYSPTAQFKKGNLVIYVELVNLGINTVPVTECSIAGFSVDSYKIAEEPDTSIELPGGIRYGVSTIDDIKEAYGNPTDTYEGDLYTKLTYEKDYYQQADLYVSNETGVLNEIELENIVYDEDSNAASAAEVSTDPTAEVLAYKTPEELGDDLNSSIVEYAGDLYQLPAPVSAFLDNGWKLDEEKSASVIAGKSSDWLYMSKDNQNFHTMVRNYSQDAASIENCFVTEVEGYIYDTNLPITIQKGITIGMTEKEVKDALNSIDYELDDSTDGYHYYNVKKGDLDGVEIMIDTEEDEVQRINVSYRPDSL